MRQLFAAGSILPSTCRDRRLAARRAVPGRRLLGSVLAASLGALALLPVARPAAPLAMRPAASQGWSSWHALAGPVAGAPDAASWSPGHLDVFARGTDGHLHHRGYPTRSGSWSAYDDLGAVSSDPAAASPQAGRVDVFARSADDHVAQLTYVSGAWSGWHHLSGAVAGSPDAASARDGTLYLVARNSANQLLLNVGSSRGSGSWSGWHPIADGITSDPSAVARHSGGSLDIFARGTAGDLRHFYRSGSSWRSESLGGILGSGPDAASWSAGRVDVFVASPARGLYQQSWSAGSGWTGWHQLSGLLTAAPGAVSWGAGRVDLFVRSSGDVLYHSAFPSASPGMSSIPAYAARYLGTGEHPDGSNCTIFATPCVPWCTYFATYVWHHVDSALPYLGFSGSVMAWAKGNGRWKSRSGPPAPGDIVVYGTSSRSTVHTGIVEHVSGGRITTIEGNYSNKVTRVGPFDPATRTSPAPILGYASPVRIPGARSVLAPFGTRTASGEYLPPPETLEQILSQDGGR